MKFIDSTEIQIESGHGGRGQMSFRSGKNAPKMGADGGDGGFGGHVYFEGDKGSNTLMCLKYHHLYKAEDGQRGGSNGRTGRNGEDAIIRVPLGTVVYNKEDGKLLAEITEDGERIQVAKGGKRGLGNLRYLRPTHQAPEESTPGGEGIHFEVKIELKLIADIGFAGFPNAGKSTLLSVISAAKPKIADYPFTTLKPQLGVVNVDEDSFADKSFVAADIPGLIEGASDGRGLGHDFLKHLERTKAIAYVLDGFTDPENTPEQQYLKLQYELAKFSPEMGNKPSFVVITKNDIRPEDFDLSDITEYFEHANIPFQVISSATHDGIIKLKRKLFKLISKAPTPVISEAIVPALSGYQFIGSQAQAAPYEPTAK